MIGILALQGGVSEHARMLEILGREYRLVRRVEHLEGLTGIILPGGESTTISTLLELGGLLEPLRHLVQQGLPAYGTCAGMILLSSRVLDTRADAHCLGALDITVRRNAFGRQVDSFEETLDIAGKKVNATFIRAPWVEEIGPGVEVLARTANGAIVAVKHNHVLATSFHPELGQDTTVHELFIDMVDNSTSA
ncbi:pyridoxal 5'-phosphate synthase glutaminase subunit PdxT [Corynebacterium sp. ES2730-CONJ]|uniref:pyridoxal 5'-phosphate synthase glutaminase subunit PdxT n=1 Tax=Corynebacterium sp. ES2730-CONJ TaxID=2973941 RepID=UPI00216AB80E|nr:pyridoxal 5'-phosphate synthase glutaminase subunit PdxT [Corynebacterium sp. ES2730-CONJ]MCS4532446.1 pyridoxal 5'-phosphate synthase glutaminase subunit PdxT [Corynebacterium sp. ES2730-CONJ]